MNSWRCGHSEDFAPFAEWLIGCDHHGPPLVTRGDQLEQHARFGLILGDVGDVVPGASGARSAIDGSARRSVFGFRRWRHRCAGHPRVRARVVTAVIRELIETLRTHGRPAVLRVVAAPSPNSAYPGDQSSCPHCGAGCSSLRRAETTLSQGATRTIKSCANH